MLKYRKNLKKIRSNAVFRLLVYEEIYEQKKNNKRKD